MASAYRSIAEQASDSESNASDLSASEGSTSTIQENSLHNSADSDVGYTEDDEKASPKRTSLPLELKHRILMLTSRGVSYRHRHLLNDLHSLLPHSYKDTKLDTKSSNNYNATLNGLADLHSCNYVFFLEARKRAQDLYLWLARAPNGPTIKFSISNIHTMGELGFAGNCLKGGRGVVVFDKSFDDQMAGFECRSLMREMLRGVFCVPSRGVRGLKPFVDRVIGIYGLDSKIWIRVYEIREAERKRSENQVDGADITLVEVGPRLVLTPVVVLEGSFGGPLLYSNNQFVSSNQLRAESRDQRANKYARRKGDTEERVLKRRSLGITHDSRKLDALSNTVVFGKDSWP